MVFKCRPAVQDETIVHELHIAALHVEAYRQRLAPAHFLQHFDRLLIRRRQRHACRFVALQQVEAKVWYRSTGTVRPALIPACGLAGLYKL